MKNYIKRIRSKLGSEKFIHPAARIIIENEQEEILFISRRDNDRIGLPAGAIEENETIENCIRREVEEETGLRLIEIEVIGISSNPEIETVKYPNGDVIQYFTVEFYSNKWEGEIEVNDTKEVKSAQFLHKETLNQLPANEISIKESLDYFRKNKRIRLK